MTRQEKHNIVDGLVERLASNNYFYIVNAEGLTVEEVNDFRRKCFQAGIVYQVVKNTFIIKALEKLAGEVDYTALNDEVLKGFSGILFAKDIGNTPARVIQDFRKQRGIASPLLKGASIDQALFIGEEHLETLGKLKSKTELIGEIVALLQSPVTRVVTSLQSGKHQLAGMVKALSEKES